MFQYIHSIHTLYNVQIGKCYTLLKHLSFFMVKTFKIHSSTLSLKKKTVYIITSIDTLVNNRAPELLSPR